MIVIVIVIAALWATDFVMAIGSALRAIS